MTKEEFLNEYWFNFPIPNGTTHILEYTPKNDGNVDAIQKVTLNNAGYLTDSEMRLALSQKLIIEKNYEFDNKDAQFINEIHEEYNRLY